jgi:putative membrane protein
MIVFFLLLVVSIFVAFFATQNTAPTSITIATYSLKDIPMYLIVLVSLLIGFILSSLINLKKIISSALTISSKDMEIKDADHMISELTKRVHQLELENTRLETLNGEQVVDEKSL